MLCVGIIFIIKYNIYNKNWVKVNIFMFTDDFKIIKYNYDKGTEQ